jgi:hypothetical protein
VCAGVSVDRATVHAPRIPTPTPKWTRPPVSRGRDTQAAQAPRLACEQLQKIRLGPDVS